MFFDLVTYGLLASIFVVNTLRIFIDKPSNSLQRAALSWDRLLRRRLKPNGMSANSKFDLR
jgi:hypothetical protein